MDRLIAAPHTPLDAAGALAPGAIARQADLLAEAGVDGAFVCGTTGEGPSLAVDERMRTAERWVAASRKRFPVLVHVGHTSLPEARALAAHAERAGADAVSALAPFYFKPSRVEDLADFCADVAAAAPSLPFYYYDIPALTGVSLPMPDFLAAAAPRIPTLRGIKFTRNDPAMFRACREYDGGRFEILWGVDEFLLDALAAGATAAVGSTYNYAAPLYRRVIQAFRDGDLETARREQATACALVEVLARFGVLRAGKAIMGLLGVDCGPPRRPVPPLSPEEMSRLYDAIRRFDVFARPLAPPGVPLWTPHAATR